MKADLWRVTQRQRRNIKGIWKKLYELLLIVLIFPSWHCGTSSIVFITNDKGYRISGFDCNNGVEVRRSLIDKRKSIPRNGNDIYYDFVVMNTGVMILWFDEIFASSIHGSQVWVDPVTRKPIPDSKNVTKAIIIFITIFTFRTNYGVFSGNLVVLNWHSPVYNAAIRYNPVPGAQRCIVHELVGFPRAQCKNGVKPLNSWVRNAEIVLRVFKQNERTKHTNNGLSRSLSPPFRTLMFHFYRNGQWTCARDDLQTKRIHVEKKR